MTRRVGTPRTARAVAALALLTGLVGSVLVAPSTATADPDVLITDVSETHPFVEAIGWLADQGITTGYPNGDGSFAFRPSDAVLRGLLAEDHLEDALAGAPRARARPDISRHHRRSWESRPLVRARYSCALVGLTFPDFAFPKALKTSKQCLSTTAHFLLLRRVPR